MIPKKESNGVIQELALKESERRWNDASERLKYATDYALAGLKGLFLANGAAIVALMTFVGNAEEPRFDKLGIWWAFAWFTFGLASVILTNILGYVSQASYMQASLQQSQKADSAAYETGNEPSASKSESLGSLVEYAGIGLAVFSLVAFLIGAFVALDAIT